MICGNPFVRNGAAFACQDCLACRSRRRRIWAHRIVLEGMTHREKAFCTLTYRDEDLYYQGGLPSLKAQHLTLWLKRLRSAIEPRRVRYFAVGEYGETTWRPHYHVMLFGFPTCLRGQTRLDLEYCCVNCDTISRTWGCGAVELRGVGIESACYVAGYTTKKLTRKDDGRLAGRYPEFARMSTDPGIGAGAMKELVKVVEAYPEQFKVDVPSVLAHGREIIPLGKYLQRRLRVQVGRVPDAPKEVIAEAAAELRALQESTGIASIKKAIQSSSAGALAEKEWRRSNLERKKL